MDRVKSVKSFLGVKGLTKLSKLNKLGDIEHRLNSLATVVSSIEMWMSQPEKEVSVLYSKTKTINKSVDELKKSSVFF